MKVLILVQSHHVFFGQSSKLTLDTPKKSKKWAEVHLMNVILDLLPEGVFGNQEKT